MNPHSYGPLIKIMVFLFLLTRGLDLWANPTATFIALGLNEVQELPLGNHDPISVEKKDVLLMKPSGATLKIQGQKFGQSLLKLGTRSYRVAVVDEKQKEQYEKLKDFINNYPRLHLGYQKNNFLLQGEIVHPTVWLSLAQQHLSGFELQAHMSKETLKVVEFFLNEDLKGNGHFPLKLRQDPYPTVRLAKSVFGDGALLARLAHFGITVIEDKRQIRPEPLIRVHVLLAEVRKSFGEGLGIQWPYQASAQILPEGLFPSEKGLSVMAQFFAREGMGRILAHPLLLTKSGSEAEFFAGGEFPIESQSRQGHQVTWKKYGIALKVKPQSDPDGKISLELNSEISSIDSGEKADGVPSLFKNTLSTHFDLNSSQTIALSGLLKKVSGNSLKKWPGLGELPLLGSLFRSTDFQEDKTELLVFVTPEIVTQD